MQPLPEQAACNVNFASVDSSTSFGATNCLRIEHSLTTGWKWLCGVEESIFRICDLQRNDLWSTGIAM